MDALQLAICSLASFFTYRFLFQACLLNLFVKKKGICQIASNIFICDSFFIRKLSMQCRKVSYPEQSRYLSYLGGYCLYRIISTHAQPSPLHSLTPPPPVTPTSLIRGQYWFLCLSDWFKALLQQSIPSDRLLIVERYRRPFWKIIAKLMRGEEGWACVEMMRYKQ